MSEAGSDHLRATVVLLQKGNRFIFYQPGLGVISSGENLEGAYDRFVGARRAFFEDVDRAGLTLTTASPVPVPTGPPGLPARVSVTVELGLFLAKTSIIILLIAAIGAVVSSGVTRSVDRLASTVSQVAEPLKKISMFDIVIKAEDIARDVQGMPDDRKESLRQSIGVLSREFNPIGEAWRNPPLLPGVKTAPAVK